jgi:hypothetical protein
MKKEIWIKIGHVDNRMVIFLNGETIWDSGIIHNDPELHKAVDITNLLNPQENYANELIFEGFNDTFNENGRPEDLNPWHFSYRVVCRTIADDGQMLDETDVIHPYDEKHMSNPNIRALNNAYVLKLKNGDYRVVSNALSQQFAE